MAAAGPATALARQVACRIRSSMTACSMVTCPEVVTDLVERRRLDGERINRSPGGSVLVKRRFRATSRPTGNAIPASYHHMRRIGEFDAV
jgi:hypothetical protein